MDALKLKTTEPATGENLIKLAQTIDQFEHYSRPHASQLARLSEALAIRIGLSAADLNSIKLAALLHDIGELAVDIAGVRQSGPLNFKQRVELWRHPIVSEQQLAKRGLSRQAQLLVRWHHEWWNGTGYPDMLAGEAIPIGARILRLVDTYDALTARRPYREAYTEEQANEIIAAGAGIEFEPLLVKIFFQMLAEMAAAAQEATQSVNLPQLVDEIPVSTQAMVDSATDMQSLPPIDSDIILTTPAVMPVFSSDTVNPAEPIESLPIPSLPVAELLAVETATEPAIPVVETIDENKEEQEEQEEVVASEPQEELIGEAEVVSISGSDNDSDQISTRQTDQEIEQKPMRIVSMSRVRQQSSRVQNQSRRWSNDEQQ
jgi:hypothetical protein